MKKDSTRTGATLCSSMRPRSATTSWLNKFKLLAFAFMALLSVNQVWGAWTKVTSAPTDWSGEYLLVYESSTTAGVAWTGVDAVSCNVAVSIKSGSIADKPTDAVSITIATMDGGYSIKVNGGTNNGKYIKGTSGSNALGFDNNAQLNTLSYDATNKGVLITSNTSVMRYNDASNNYRFRYFKSSTYTSQKIVQLYKKAASTYTVLYSGQKVGNFSHPFSHSRKL
ncbi:MAG: hypothetical protein KBS69_06900 [Bacteroidales bacterium]|nr:hypothetical protein [Candidatus Colicola caccequi]